MFIITAKVSGRKMAIGAAVLAAVLLAASAGAGLAGDIAAFSAKESVTAEQTESESNERTSTLALTKEQRIAYLEACGWEIDASTGTVREVIIPSDFDETYQSYADLQARQGFELEQYRGKRVKQVTYEVTNYPQEGEVLAELLIYRGRIIAGDICSMKTDGGFTRGLMDHPEEEQKEQQTNDTSAEKSDSNDQ